MAGRRPRPRQGQEAPPLPKRGSSGLGAEDEEMLLSMIDSERRVCVVLAPMANAAAAAIYLWAAGSDGQAVHFYARAVFQAGGDQLPRNKLRTL